MRINVATDNPIKVRAVEGAFRALFSDPDLIVTRVAGPGPGQPIGDETVSGAILRARAARAGDPDFAVGIEAGLIRFPGAPGWFAVQVCAIVDRGGRLSLGFGPAFQIPDEIIEPILSGEEMRDVIRKAYRLSEEEAGRGLIHLLSSGRIDRIGLTQQAVAMALLPWMAAR